MERNDSLKRVLSCLADRNLGGALTELRNFFALYSQPQAEAELEPLLAEYQMMSNYWKRGYKDPQLEANFNRLLQRTCQLYADTSRWRRIMASPFMSTVYSSLAQQPREWSVANIRQELEAYVSDVAMVSLEPANKQKTHLQELNTRHLKSMSQLFDYLWTSRHWSDATAQAFEEMLLSPTVDATDQQLMISAMTLSLLNTFDMAKFRVLVHVYRQALVEAVRQRALVGWVMGRSYTMTIVFPEEQQLVNEMMEDEAIRRELLELQIQFLYTVNAESDTAKIQSEIMPDLLKNNHFRITRNGVEEVEEDSLEDILHPEADEERMERVEESFRKMIDMQKEGSDIYFGGFSQMKRFPFFHRMCNWFMPFSMTHPEVTETLSTIQHNRFLQQVLRKGPFCNSDKYSFVFAFSQVLERMPQSMRDLMEQGEAAIEVVDDEESVTPTYVRRMYLQDLYRFFRLFAHTSQFDHPFKTSESELGQVLFFASPLFRNTKLELYYDKLGTMLLRRKRYEDLRTLMKNQGESHRTYTYYMLAATAIRNTKEPMDSKVRLEGILENYRNALNLNPFAEKAMQGEARILLEMERYEEAIATYDHLIAINPDKQSYVLNRAVCLERLERYEEALKPLFRLNYEQPDDVNVSRVLAWTLLGVGKYEQALTLYEKLTTVEQAAAEDFLNQGYCMWLAGNVQGAIDSFRHYLKETGELAINIINNEERMLSKKGISNEEMQMMYDAIAP